MPVSVEKLKPYLNVSVSQLTVTVGLLPAHHGRSKTDQGSLYRVISLYSMVYSKLNQQCGGKDGPQRIPLSHDDDNGPVAQHHRVERPLV